MLAQPTASLAFALSYLLALTASFFTLPHPAPGGRSAPGSAYPVRIMSLLWSTGLGALALLGSGIVYSVDVLFARIALQLINEDNLTKVVCHLHPVTDARIPLFGVAALLSTGGPGRWATLASHFALLVSAGQFLPAPLLFPQELKHLQVIATPHGQYVFPRTTSRNKGLPI